jgi:hypothetical protein
MAKQLRDMAPWDATPYYFTPQEQTFTVGNTPVQVARGDPNRTILIFGLNDALAATIYVNVSINRNPTNVSGMQVSFYQNQLLMRYDTHGPLVQQPWYAVKSQLLGPSPNLTVQTVSLNRWPADSDRLSIIEEQDIRAKRSSTVNPNNYGAVYRQRADRGAESETSEDRDIAALIARCQRGHLEACDRHVWMAPGGWRLSPGTG